MTEHHHDMDYLRVLEEELVIAVGCTEPVSLALAAAKLKTLFKREPLKITVQTSGPFFKNIRAAVVPGTKTLAGIKASIAAGHISGNPDKNLEVLASGITDDDLKRIEAMISRDIFEITLMKTTEPLHFTLRYEDHQGYAEIEVKHLHTGTIRLELNGQMVPIDDLDTHTDGKPRIDRSFMRFDDIIGFVERISAETLRSMFMPVITHNMAIANEGLKGSYGVNIGSLIQKKEATIYGRVKATAAAASEARMCGCEMPVVTNSGSGNQGITSSVPVIVYAREKQIDDRQLFKALALSALFTIHQKNFIGRLSAFCGAISAAAAAGAALTWLAGGNSAMVKQTVTNTLASAAGILCDGAKGSCGFKISTGLDAAIIAHLMALAGQYYRPGAGIIRKDADTTVKAIGLIATKGMRKTDIVILEMMTEETRQKSRKIKTYV